MARELEFWKDDGTFKVRTCGLVKQGDKYLLKAQEDYFNLPGGRVTLGENTDEAVVREIKEETSIKTKIDKLLAIEQLFLTRDDGKPFHEICFYYLLTPIKPVKTLPFEHEEIDNGERKHHTFKWFTLDEIKQINFLQDELIESLEKELERQVLFCYRK